jgi:hypothetical protein
VRDQSLWAGWGRAYDPFGSIIFLNYRQFKRLLIQGHPMLPEVLGMMSYLPRQAVEDWSGGNVSCAQACCDPLCECLQMHSWPANLILFVTSCFLTTLGQ